MSWEKLFLNDCINTTKGFAFKSQWFSQEGVPVVKVKDFTADSIDSQDLSFLPEDMKGVYEKYALRTGDVIIQTVGSWPSNPNSVVGKVVKAPNEIAGALLNQNAVRLTPNEKIDGKFLFYLLRLDSFKSYIIGTAQGSASQASITLEAIKNYQFSAPIIAIQQRIAAILSAYDELIDNNRKRISLLEKAAQLLHEEWFVRLQFPGHEHTPVVGGVPEGWENVKMSTVCQSIGGGTPSTKNDEYWNGGDVTWVTPTDITRNNCLVITDSEKKITATGLKSSSAKMLPPDTILMTSRATIGYFGLIDKEVCTNQGFISVIPNKEEYRMYLLFNLMSRKEEIEAKASGSIFKEINKSSFRDMDLILPNHTLLSTFQEQAYTIVKQVRLLKKASQKLQQARDLLLPRLMSGELAV